jgi:hypothetical protein
MKAMLQKTQNESVKNNAALEAANAELKKLQNAAAATAT